MARRVIALKGCPTVSEELVANEAITPGHLIGVSSGKWIKNTASADDVAPIFALEQDHLGKDIDTAYASGDTVVAGTFKGGDRVYAFIASGQNVAVGDYLTPDAAGRLTKTGVADGLRIARAVEAVNTTGVDLGVTRIRAEIC